MTAIEPLLSAQDVMRLLGVSRPFVTDHAADLGGIKVGGLLRFTQDGIAAYLERQRLGPAPLTVVPTPARPKLRRLPDGVNPLTGEPFTRRAAR